MLFLTYKAAEFNNAVQSVVKTLCRVQNYILEKLTSLNFDDILQNN